jgi:hypothetical protein
MSVVPDCSVVTNREGTSLLRQCTCLHYPLRPDAETGITNMTIQTLYCSTHPVRLLLAKSPLVPETVD